MQELRRVRSGILNENSGMVFSSIIFLSLSLSVSLIVATVSIRFHSVGILRLF